MPRRPSAASPTGPTALLFVSVRDWQRRVERYLVRDPKTRQIVRPIYDLDAERDERALLAMYSAYDLWGQQNAEREQNLKVAHRSRRNFWRLWAREVLTDCGFPLFARADELESAHVREDLDVALVAAASDAA